MNRKILNKYIFLPPLPFSLAWFTTSAHTHTGKWRRRLGIEIQEEAGHSPFNLQQGVPAWFTLKTLLTGFSPAMWLSLPLRKTSWRSYLQTILWGCLLPGSTFPVPSQPGSKTKSLHISKGCPGVSTLQQHLHCQLKTVCLTLWVL